MLFGSQSAQSGRKMALKTLAAVFCSLAVLLMAKGVRQIFSCCYPYVAFKFKWFHLLFLKFFFQDILGGRRQKNFFIFSSSLSSSSWSSSSERSGNTHSWRFETSTSVHCLWSLSLVLQVRSVSMGAPPSSPWPLVNTCFVCALMVLREPIVKKVRSSTANHIPFISFSFVTIPSDCFSKKRRLLCGSGTVLQRHRVSNREWANMQGVGLPHQGAPSGLRHQLREAQLLQVGCQDGAACKCSRLWIIAQVMLLRCLVRSLVSPTPPQSSTWWMV